VLSIFRQLLVKPSDLRGIGIQVSRLESDNVGSKFLDSFLIRSTRETQQVGSSNAHQEDSNTCEMPRTSNEDRSLQNRGTIHEAGPSNAPQTGSNTQKILKASNEDRSLPNKGTIHGAGPSNAPQEVSTNEDGRAARPYSQFVPHELCDLDEEVLAALPEDIRQEVLQAYQPRSSSQVNRDEVVTSLKSPTIEQVLKYVTVTMSMSWQLIL
jgi:hypothetical protein